MTELVHLLADAGIAAGLLVVASVAYRDRDQPGALPFVALAVLLALMAGGIAILRLDVLTGRRQLFAVFGPFVFASLAWLALSFDYTGRGPVVTRRLAGGLAAFGVVVVLSTAATAVVPAGLRPAWLLLINVMQLTQVAAIEYGAIVVARSGIEYGDLPLGGSLLLAAVGTALIVVTVVLFLVPPLPRETAFLVLEVLLGAIVVLLLVVQVRYRVFETGASAGHLARETVLDRMPAAVAITGRNDRLLDLNRTAERMFDVDVADDLGDPVDEALGFDPDQRDERSMTVETDEGRRVLESERVELTGQGSETVGRAYILRDVTERRTREQRLDVLNRVLRHNLRNDLDAVRGFAESMERDDGTVDDAVLARQIQRTAEDVADLGETLSTADRLLEADRLDVEPVDVEGLLHDVVGRVDAGGSDVSVTVTVNDPSATVRTDRRILAAALEEVVENAIEHNDTDTPTVGLAIEVDDDGPGIPERERAVLLEGEERPLRHGSGLGLWLVYWGVTRLGGRLEFRERDPRGSIVSIRVPDR